MRVEKDRVVAINYTLTLDSGQVVDSTSRHPNALNFIVGQNQIIPGLERSIIGMEEGDKKNIQVVPEEGYGVRDENLVQSIPRDRIPTEIELQEGQVLSAQKENGERAEVIVKSFSENEVLLDLNHPLAGENLNFEVEIVDVRKATMEEISHGHVH